ncbi:hypothetical protein SLEP1_g26658 [Rubroshorea leprosula]|nr:hypothetical protein SLEP1_g26658 [Rubroshorea leprosula]
MEQNFFESGATLESDGDLSLKQKWGPIAAPKRDPEMNSGSFQCNICLDSARDPVVTLCGHLYCWPCIYKWLHVQSSSLKEDQQQQNCPVCKTDISPSLLVPLYGPGTSSESESKTAQLDVVIPPRPQPSGLITSTSHPSQRLHGSVFRSQSQSFHHQQYFPHTHRGYAAMASSNLGSTQMTNFFNPTIGMFGEMVYARFFGSPGTSLFAYPDQNSYPFLVNNSIRMRRQEMQLDKSLNRVCIFLFCCIFLCLLLF